MTNNDFFFISVLLPLHSSRLYSYKAAADVPLVIGDFVVVPVGNRKMIGVVWQLDAKPDISEDKIRHIIEKIAMTPLHESVQKFIDWVANYTLAPTGLILKMVLQSPKNFEVEKQKTAIKFISEQLSLLTPARKKVMQFYQQDKIFNSNELATTADVSPTVINGLIKEGVLEKVAIKSDNLLHQDFANKKPQLKKFNSEQQLAVAALAKSIDENNQKNKFTCFLLEGITGSGKTEVYFEAIAKAIEQNNQVLILLPEIALTNVFSQRFFARFGVEVIIWHSQTPQGQRAKIWRGVKAGKIQVVAGARSALFLPFENLKLIIVDEEHDAAYKQEDRIFYHARDMAVARAWLGNFMCILATATPSVESRVNVENGRYQHLRLKHRVAGAELPKIELIDLREEKMPATKFISPILEEAIAETLSAKKQTLLFLNRRGFAPLLLCRACGYRFNCRQCSAWLVEHRQANKLQCHHCGESQVLPKQCPKCNEANSLVGCGPGVERIAEEVKLLFPKAKSLVLSSDTKGGVDTLKQQLAQIANGEIDIIIGTQIIAKGHDLPLISCVGVIDADLTIGGDPRSSERTFQLLWQVTGRAGRDDGGARGFLQTHNPQHPILQAMTANDFESFYQREIEIRKNASLPPFSKLVAIIVSGSDLVASETYAKALKLVTPKLVGEYEGLRLLGPAVAPLAFLRGRHRYRLLVHCRREINVQKFVRQWLSQAPQITGDIRVVVDIDPQSFL